MEQEGDPRFRQGFENGAGQIGAQSIKLTKLLGADIAHERALSRDVALQKLAQDIVSGANRLTRDWTGTPAEAAARAVVVDIEQRISPKE